MSYRSNTRGQAMYMIRHIPTKTYYGLTDTDGKYSLVGFKRKADAKYVADSIATYKQMHKRFPTSGERVCLMSKSMIKNTMEDESLWVEDHTNNMSFLYNLGKHNMDFQIVDEIDTSNDYSFQVRGRTLEIDFSPELYLETLTNDYLEED